MKFFDKSNAIYYLPPAPTTPPEVPCSGCPSETGEGEPSTSS
jgi:hypothetical protein